MSEPITRADYAKWLLSCGDLEMHAMFEDWCAHNPAESASPPRVPGASAQSYEVGVQSGPGQPIDYERGYRAGVEAAALTASAIALAPVGRIRDTATISCYERGEQMRAAIIAAIRALADKPAPDERKRCLEIVQRHIDAEVHATFADGATLQDAFAAGCGMTAKTIFDDIAGTQRFARPIKNIDGDAKQERFDAPFAARKGG